MLILAGVSLNAIVGDNGIITNAQNATILDSCAELQQFFNEYYVSNFETVGSSKSKVEAIQTVHPKWFYQTPDGYITDAQGHALFLIDKENFIKDNPNFKNLKGGDAGNKTYNDYYNLNDVYGVTKDLNVYYCTSGTNEILGVESSNLDNEDFRRVVFEEDNPLSKKIEHSSNNGVTISDARNVDNIVIDDSVDVSDLNFLYRLTSLKELVIKDKNEDELSLNGLEFAVNLETLTFQNCNLSNYDELKYLSNLKHLYLYKSNDEEVNKVCNSMSNVNYNQLNSFGILGVSLDTQSSYWYTSGSKEQSNVTNVSSIMKLSAITKKNIKYLFLNNNSIESLEDNNGVSVVSDFVNCEYLLLQGNNLKSLPDLSNLKKLYLLSIQNNIELGSIVAIDKTNIKTLIAYNTSINDLDPIKNLTKMQYLDLRNITNFTDASPIANLMSLNIIYLAGCTNMKVESIVKIRDAYNRVSIYWKNIPSKYNDYLVSSDTKLYNGKGYSDSTDKIKALESDTNIITLDLSYNNSLGNTQFSTLDNATQTKILNKLGNITSSKANDAYFRYLLSTLSNLKYLSLRNISNLKYLDFIRFLPNIVELDLCGTGITDISILDNLILNNPNKLSNLGCLLLDNSSIDLTKAQKTIEQVSTSPKNGVLRMIGDAQDRGLVILNKTLLNSLNNCKEITNLYLSTGSISETMDLTGCSSLKYYTGYYHRVIKMPNSLKSFYGWHIEFPIFNGSSTNPSKLTSIDVNNASETTQIGFTNMLKSLEYNKVENEELSIKLGSLYGVSNFYGISYLKNCKISSFYWGWTYDKLNDISDLSNLSGGIGYIKTLTIDTQPIKSIPSLKNVNISALNIVNSSLVDISGLVENDSIVSLNLDNNSIQNLKPIENMKNLQKLSLYGNKLYNSYNDATNNIKIDNLDIIYKINKKINSGYNCVYVNLRSNYFTDTEEYEKVKNSYSSDSYF